MKAYKTAAFFITAFLSFGLSSGIAAEDASVSESEPKGVAPLAAEAVVLPKDADDPREHAWSIRLRVPKVEWEVVGEQRPKREWTKIKADVEMMTLDVNMGYPGATQLSELGQNRLVDIDGKRLSRDEARKRLAESTPVLVSVSGEMPDPFYLRCFKRDTLIVLFGLPTSAEYNLLPTSRATRSEVE